MMMEPRRQYLTFFWMTASLLAPAAQAAAAVCDKPLRGAWRVVADITPAGEIVGITDLMEKRMMKAEALFSPTIARFDGNTCMIRGVTRTSLSQEEQDLYRNDVLKKYPVEIDFKCATEEGVGGFRIGERCDEIVTDWEGAYFLMKPKGKAEAGHR